MDGPVAAAPAAPPAAAATRPVVLAVDDAADSLRLLRLRLHHAGMEVHTCSSARQAMEVLQKKLPDLIILDVRMPGMDGYEMCRVLKAHEATRDIPVLFLTDNALTEDRVQGFEVGGHDYLTKPVDEQELIVRVRAALHVKRLQDELKAQLALQQEQLQARLQAQERVSNLQQAMVTAHWQKLFGQLAASLAHEINNPLAAALGSVQLMMVEEGLREDLRDRLHLADLSLRRAAENLRRLLLIAHPARHPSVVSLAQLAEDIAALSNLEIVVHNITLRLALDPACQWKGMPSELGRALLYLLNNAIEAVSGRPDPEITVKVERDSQRQFIRVSDNGAGISEAARAHIFEPFFTTKGPPHTGAGLYLANAIVKAANGVIEFRSPAEGAVTEFTINLPQNVNNA
ncbi:MAG: response regulator [Verrucomicrobia bacterium]|nr:response regulator [Verrucomicrobiota bacterium]